MRAVLVKPVHSWVDETFNPWLDASPAPTEGDRRLLPWQDPSLRVAGQDQQALRWQAQAEDFSRDHGGRRRRVFAGPWCTVLGGAPDPKSRACFWQLVRRTPNVDWLVIADDGFADGKSLPADWERGYDNVWVGAALTSIATTGAVLACLRQVPAKLRFALATPAREDLGDLDLRGIGWVVISLGDTDKIDDPDAIASVKAQATYQGVPVWFDLTATRRTRRSAAACGVFEVQEAPRVCR